MSLYEHRSLHIETFNKVTQNRIVKLLGQQVLTIQAVMHTYIRDYYEPNQA